VLKMVVDTSTRPGGTLQSARAITVPALGPRCAGRMAGMRGQEKGGMPPLPPSRDTGTRARLRGLRRAGRGSQA